MSVKIAAGLKITAVLLLGLLSAAYLGEEIIIRREAQRIATAEAPNGRYRIECFAGLGREESKLVLRVFDRQTKSTSEYRKKFFNGAFKPHWVCQGSQCSEFRWSARDGDGIALPSSRIARLRGHLPWGGAAPVETSPAFPRVGAGAVSP